ncbi:Polyketide cyclase / dehydrase and lipid transport [Streptomyces sp. S4.7]|uniref:SRPBCC family protein n=1 Tax=Streptomyces sp. S4.7 TaxID=2705439 RepID=UPI001398405D|nr:Polyketide cyclase / dehydrase and lipid transport [Streptomyces sp. S4.7]
MRSVTVSIDVPQSAEQVYDFLDVMAHHERFTDHYLTNWRYSGPGRGVGSGATVTAALGGTKADVTIEVVEAEPPRRIVERNISAAGRRQAHGTYDIEPLPAGGSRVSFTSAGPDDAHPSRPASGFGAVGVAGRCRPPVECGQGSIRRRPRCSGCSGWPSRSSQRRRCRTRPCPPWTPVNRT